MRLIAPILKESWYMKPTKVITICITVFLTLAVIAETVFIAFLLNRDTTPSMYQPLSSDFSLCRFYAEIHEINYRNGATREDAQSATVLIRERGGYMSEIGVNQSTEIYFNDGAPAKISDLDIGQELHIEAENSVNSGSTYDVQVFTQACYRIIIFE